MRRWLALLLLAAVATGAACGRVGPPVRRSPAPRPEASQSAEPAEPAADPKDEEEKQP